MNKIWNGDSSMLGPRSSGATMDKGALNIIEKIEIPKGRLFYPSCGHDTLMPTKLFKNKVDEFNFVDIMWIPFTRYNRIRNLKVINSYSTTKHLSDDVIKLANGIFKPRTNYKIEKSYLVTDKVKNITNNKTIFINRYKQDGLTIFYTLDKISVFYLVGDSAGEGGSGQFWFQPGLFDEILNKLIDGGLIVTDGSGKPELMSREYNESEWSGLWKHDEQIGKFVYKDRKFKLQGIVGKRYGPIKVWQVKKI